MAVGWVSFVLAALAGTQIPEPSTPYIVKHACPFECCQLGTWVAESSLPAYPAEGDTSDIGFVVAPGETIEALDADVRMEQFGQVLVKAPWAGYSAGDTVLVLGYEGEGSFSIWHAGTLRHVEMFWWIPPELTAPEDRPDLSDPALRPRAEMIVPPVMDWWVRVRRQGVEGYLRLRNRTNFGFSTWERIRGSDGCG